MYALAARDKLHKLEKEQYDQRHSPKVGRSNGKRNKGKEERPTSVQKEARYVGTFLLDGGKKADFVKVVKHQLARVNPKSLHQYEGKGLTLRIIESAERLKVERACGTKSAEDPSHALLHVSLLINMEGIKAISYDTHDVVMAHPLRKILYCTSESKKHLFAIVSRDAQDDNEQVYTHVFVTAKKDQANELNQIVSKAFKMHFARATIARERKQAARHSSLSQPQRPPSGQRAQRNRSTSPQPSASAAARGRSSSPQPPTDANLPPYNPNVVPRSGGRVGGGVSDSSLQQRPAQTGLQGSHSSSHVSSAPPPARKSWVELNQEASVVEQEVASIQTRLAEIAVQKQELAGFQDAISQLVAQETPLHQQLESKRRQLAAIQFQLQDAAVQEFSHMHLQPPQAGSALPAAAAAAGYPGEPPPYSPSMSPRMQHTVHDPLPTFSLEEAAWFHEGIPRDIAMEILAQQPEGSFMVRNSSSNPGSYALSMKGPQRQIHHFLIQALPNGFKLQTSGLVFPNVVDLIHSYTVNKDILPCVLELSATNPMGMNGDDHGFDSDDEFSQFQNAEYRLLP